MALEMQPKQESIGILGAAKMSDEQELKPCDRCGYIGLIDKIEYHIYLGFTYKYQIFCKNPQCTSSTKEYETEDDAVNAWNTGSFECQKS